MSPKMKIQSDDIKAIPKSEVLKRDIVEGEERWVTLGRRFALFSGHARDCIRPVSRREPSFVHRRRPDEKVRLAPACVHLQMVILPQGR
jgi:hypothetical protein